MSLSALPATRRPAVATPQSRRGGGAVAVLATVLRIWWRRLSNVVGVGGGLAFLALVASGVALYWVLVWPQVSEAVGGLTRSSPDLARMVLVSALVTYLVVLSVIRVMLLTFDYVSSDLRILVETSPLSRWQRAAVYVAPEFAALVAVGGVLGSMTLVVFATGSTSISVAEVVCWSVALCALVGLLGGALELFFEHLVRDSMAARGGAGIVLLGSTTALMVLLMRDINGYTTARSGVAVLGEWLEQWSTVVSCLAALALTAVSLTLWSVVAGAATRSIFRHAGQPLRVSAGRYVSASAMSLVRDASNRVGYLGLVALAALGVCGELFGHLPVGVTALNALATLAIGSAAVMAYGDYLELRWRVLVAPARAALPCLGWISGHLAAATVAVTVPVVAAEWLLPLDVAPGTSRGALAAALFAVAGGVVAGRLFPYRKDDVFGIFVTGSLALLLSAGPWWVCHRLLGDTAWGTSAVGSVLVLVAVLGVVLSERPSDLRRAH